MDLCFKRYRYKHLGQFHKLPNFLVDNFFYFFVMRQNLHHHMTKREIEYYFGVDHHDKGNAGC